MRRPVTADAIANVVADLHTGRVRLLDPHSTGIADHAHARIHQPTVVDCTAIYQSLIAKDDPVYIYEDHPSIAPPWPEAAYAYRNEHGNVIVMHATTVDADSRRWDTAHPVDWDAVRWVVETFVWVGGRSRELGGFITTGPVHMWQYAIGAAGQPLDLHWVQLVGDYPMQHWDMAHLVLLGGLNFLNCSNVDAVEPRRPRAERRRIARTGVRVHEIVVRTAGRTSHTVATGDGGGVPLTSVRGHFAHHGNCCPDVHEPRGLLFGRLTGRYWKPAHARGAVEHGESAGSYRLKVDQ